MPSSSTPWEEAYTQFQTPEQEIRKFIRRLHRLGAAAWPRDAHIMELFCGRGNGLCALSRMGFLHIEGVDLSPQLAAQYSGPGTIHVADCRALPMKPRSQDIVIVQGGLHHLPRLPDDLARTLDEACRILRPDGRFVCVEPWLTIALRSVHAISRNRLARRLWRPLDAFARMVEYEGETYEQWLAQPSLVLDLLRQRFRTERCIRSWCKLLFVGRV